MERDAAGDYKHPRHVVGRYTERMVDPATGMPEPQKIVATCTVCSAEWRGECLTGAVRSHINRFATVHLHRDVMAEGITKWPKTE